jgi:hypothetical protein
LSIIDRFIIPSFLPSFIPSFLHSFHPLKASAVKGCAGDAVRTTVYMTGEYLDMMAHQIFDVITLEE